MCALNALLFWGGWLPPHQLGRRSYLHSGHHLAVREDGLFFFFVFSWVKATVAGIATTS